MSSPLALWLNRPGSPFSSLLFHLWLLKHFTTVAFQILGMVEMQTWLVNIFTNHHISFSKTACQFIHQPMKPRQRAFPHEQIPKQMRAASINKLRVDPPLLHGGHHFRCTQIASQHLPEGTGRLMWGRGGEECVVWSRLKAACLWRMSTCECMHVCALSSTLRGGFHLSGPFTSDKIKGRGKERRPL